MSRPRGQILDTESESEAGKRSSSLPKNRFSTPGEPQPFPNNSRSLPDFGFSDNHTETYSINDGSSSDSTGAEQQKSARFDQTKPSGEPLDRREKQELEKLERRDREVRKHERTHQATGGQHVRGGVQFEFKQGPNGERFAVGGSVKLDTSKESEPQRTIQKMRQVRAAALAPAQPSPKDLSVAQSASKKASEARRELSEEQQRELQEASSSTRNQSGIESSKSQPPATTEQTDNREFNRTSRPEVRNGPEISTESFSETSPGSAGSQDELFPRIQDPEVNGAGAIETLETSARNEGASAMVNNDPRITTQQEALGSEVDFRV